MLVLPIKLQMRADNLKRLVDVVALRRVQLAFVVDAESAEDICSPSVSIRRSSQRFL